jgi:hypothetical protein
MPDILTDSQRITLTIGLVLAGVVAVFILIGTVLFYA